MRATIWCGLVLGVAVLGGWWAARAAALGPDARSEAAEITTPDDDGFRKLLDDVAKMVDKQKKERGIQKLPVATWTSGSGQQR